MPAYNFKECFADDVQSGKKRQTVRAVRKRETKSGDPLYLYTGMRTKRCRKLLTTTCREIKSIEIGRNGIRLGGTFFRRWSEPVWEFARADGFGDAGEMIQWFNTVYGLPFFGVVIYW